MVDDIVKKITSKFILWFDEIDKSSIPMVGGKGANLGEMVKIGMPVPDGFAVNTVAFEHFLKMNMLDSEISDIISGCDVDDTEQLNGASARIKRRIIDSDMPLSIRQEVTRAYDSLSVAKELPEEMKQFLSAGRDMAIVAVRSSATTEDLADASFAGQQASFLNVKGIPYLMDAIKRCWASLYEPRAIFYRNMKGFKHASISVIVQKMVNSEKSGVTFTVNPSTGEDTVIHEATWGLGESLVLGRVNPDMYAVSKGTMEIIDRKIGKKEMKHVRDIGTERTVEIPVPDDRQDVQVLSDGEVKELTEYALKLEKHYHKPQDIEWAIERSKIYIVQTRPVTAVGGKVKGNLMEGAILEGIAASPGSATGPVKVASSVDDASRVEKGDVLVTEMTSPEFVPAMSKCVAIVTEKGGTTSHAAIVSREMGLPCIVGAKDATRILKEGQIVTVDGGNGVVYDGKVTVGEPEKTEIARKTVKVKKRKDIKPIRAPKKPKLYMNLGMVEKIDEYKDLPFEGIGLMRIEFIIAALGKHPKALIEEGRSDEYVDALKDGISKVASAVHPRPVIVRFSDLKTNEYNDLEGGDRFEPKEENPMIGWRGASRFVSDEFNDVFRLECKAVREVREQSDNVWVMLPFVRTIQEMAECMEIIKDEGLKRGEDFKVWIMAEVPSVVILADEFAQVCDGISIGSNDLTQLILGVDRDSEILNRLGYFNEQDDAVKSAIKQLIEKGHKNGCRVSICGQAPSEYPEFVKFLVKSGIDSISVNPDVVESTKKLIS